MPRSLRSVPARLTRLLPAAAVVGCLLSRAEPAPPPEQPPTAVAIIAALDSTASESLWPGFEPRRVPVAIYDGAHTYLFRHPAPPEEFASPAAGAPLVVTGRHPAVTANTWIELNGVPTATVVFDAAERGSARDFAALVVHEAYHAFQVPRHPNWAGNEAELFVYPVFDADLLAMRRLESEALRRSVATVNRGRAACWARLALEWRKRRFRALPPGAVAYERGTELHEGLAQYVQSRALGMVQGRGIPVAGFAVEAVRTRAYAVGEALALTLDRFDSHWQEKLDAGHAGSLDELLAGTLEGHVADFCGFSDRERSFAFRQARVDVQSLREGLAAQQREFLARPGWRVVIVAGRPEPLWPQAFDPLNATSLGDGQVLHRRWLKIGNSLGAMEILGQTALTVASGDHPLFTGIREVTIGGLAEEPVVRRDTAAVVIEAPGVRGAWRDARVSRTDRVVTLVLGATIP